MSGQYPPPNPYSGHHQRAPTSPWAHSHPRHPQSHPSGMVWSPHVGLPVRNAQMWQPKPVDSRPLYGLQMMMGPPRYPQQQEETMDLSASSQDVPKPMGDPLRNGTVNGETESVVTSVIATNPLRETPSTDPINCSKRVEEASKIWESSDSSLNVSETGKNLTSSVLVPDDVGVEHMLKSETTDVDRLSEFSFSRNFVKETEEQSSQSQNLESKSEHTDDDGGVKTVEHPNQDESNSYMDSSCLSVDTDESRLVVAESSAEDIFGISPVENMTDTTSQETEKIEGSSGVISESSNRVISEGSSGVISEGSSEVISEGSSGVISEGLSGVISECPSGVISSTSITDNSALKDQWALRPEMSAVPSSQSTGPDPSVENVETLLESMFNSQEETSCSSQTSCSGVPQSVIVSSGVRLPVETAVPPVDIVMPMKEEELAKTLAEDILIESDIKEEEKKDEGKDESIKETDEDLLSNKQEEPKSINKNPVPDLPKTDDQIKKEISVSESDNNEFEDKKINKENSENNLQNSILEPSKEDKSVESDMSIELLASNPEASTSSNPFIEVETQLEKMFAGIVEPVDDVSSDALTRPSSSEPTKLASGKKAARKRKKANNRRPSDNSLFGGSSGESSSLRKKGKKRLQDSCGNEKSSKKLKTECVDNLKKGKAVKDNVNDGLSSKVKGPFVHIEGPKESPASVVVVNSGSRADDDDGVDKTSTRWKHSPLQKKEGVVRKPGPAYSSSTLSMRYNSDTPDVTWVCVFCKRGPHCVGGLGGEPAGDLFGPYRVPLTPPSDDVPLGTPSDKDVTEEQKRRGGGKFPKSIRACGMAETFVQKAAAKKGKRSASHEGLDQPGLLPVGDSYEVWLHEQCAIWAPGLCVIGTQLVGLEDSVWSSLRTKCWQCGAAGAGLGCVAHNCPTRMHYHCAKVSGWLLDNDSFIARCQTHRTRLRP